MDELDTTPTPSQAASHALGRSRIIIYALVVLGVLVVAGLLYYFVVAPKNPQQAAADEARRVVAAVGKLIVLPPDEQPIIATVADPSKLEGQPFFQNAKKGDKVLIYNNAKKAILYSPEQNRVVDVAPLSIGKPTPTPAR